MVTVGAKITLKGKTNKGKKIIKQNGADYWEVLRVENKVLFSQDKGPWLLLKPNFGFDIRWVHAQQDLNFEILF